MKKITLLVVGAAGYVLGSRAGHERYAQIKQQTTRAWTSPTVQGVVDDAQTHAKQAAADLKDTVVDKVTSSGDSSDPDHADHHQQASTITPGVGTA